MSRFHPSAIWGTDAHVESSQTNEASENDLPPSNSVEAHLKCVPNSFGLGSRTAFFLPVHYEKSYQYPLVVWLHNDGHNENQVTQVVPHISMRNYIAVGVRGSRATDTSGHCFEWRSSQGAIQTAYENVVDAIDESQRRYSINPSRIVLAGYQSGGTMAMRIAFRDPHLFAGVVSLGGRMPEGRRLFSNLEDLRNKGMPMLWQWAIHNPQFSQQNLEQDMRTSMMIGTQLEIRQYRDDDEMNTVALADANQWIMNRIVCRSPSTESTSNQPTSWQSEPTQFSCN